MVSLKSCFSTGVLKAEISGGTNYKGQLVFLGEGQGPDIPSAIYQVNPTPPYTTKGKLQYPI